MVLKTIKWTFIGVLGFVVLYLGIVWLWANSAAPDLLSRVPSSSSQAGLKPHHLDALIKIEDPTFYTHGGLDISNGQGLTTITSAVARTVFLGEHQLDGLKGTMQSFYRGVFNCCKRIDFGRDIMALVLNSHTVKQEQLSLFLSSTYLGSSNGKGVIGIKTAAATYYDKELSQLTDNEFYGLVAMVIAPNDYHPEKNPQLHAQRVKRIKAVVNGQCEPDGWLDLTYEHCDTES